MKYMVAFLVVAAASCGGTGSPTGPAPAAVAVPPGALPPPPGPSIAVLTVDAFTVTSRRCSNGFCYVPAIRVSEASGKSAARVTALQFDLNAGVDGRVPTLNYFRQVPAGGTLDLVGDFYGEPELEISSNKVDAATVSLAIGFLDDQGRQGVLNAVAAVSR